MDGRDKPGHDAPKQATLHVYRRIRSAPYPRLSWRRLLQYRGEFRQGLFDDFRRRGFEPAGAARAEIERAGLVAADDATRLRAGAGQRNREAGGAGEIAAARDRQDDRRFRQKVEGGGRDDEHRQRPPLLMARRRIERNEINVAALLLNQL